MAKGLCAFQITDAPVSVTERVRRAIGQADVSTVQIRRILAAVERLRLKAEAPVYLNDCWAHVGIPKLKVAIYSKLSLDHAQVATERELWKSHGWVMLAICQRKVAKLSDENLTEQLRLALVELGKVK